MTFTHPVLTCAVSWVAFNSLNVTELGVADLGFKPASLVLALCPQSHCHTAYWKVQVV